MSESIHLSNAAGDSAGIALFGAELSAWRAGGVDLIWVRAIRRFWDLYGAGTLFPVVGWTRDGMRGGSRGRAIPLVAARDRLGQGSLSPSAAKIFCAWSLPR